MIWVCVVAMPIMALGFPVKLPCLTERERGHRSDYLIRQLNRKHEWGALWLHEKVPGK